MVAVLSKTGVRLMPTTRFRARKLLKGGRAVIEKYLPFTIRLLDREDGDVQEIEFCCDTGYIHNGSVSNRKNMSIYPFRQTHWRMRKRSMRNRRHTAGEGENGNVTGSPALITGNGRKSGCRPPLNIRKISRSTG